jgi:hypothetical protein
MIEVSWLMNWKIDIFLSMVSNFMPLCIEIVSLNILVFSLKLYWNSISNIEGQTTKEVQCHVFGSKEYCLFATVG